MERPQQGPRTMVHPLRGCPRETPHVRPLSEDAHQVPQQREDRRGFKSRHFRHAVRQARDTDATLQRKDPVPAGNVHRRHPRLDEARAVRLHGFAVQVPGVRGDEGGFRHTHCRTARALRHQPNDNQEPRI